MFIIYKPRDQSVIKLSIRSHHNILVSSSRFIRIPILLAYGRLYTTVILLFQRPGTDFRRLKSLPALKEMEVEMCELSGLSDIHLWDVFRVHQLFHEFQVFGGLHLCISPPQTTRPAHVCLHAHSNLEVTMCLRRTRQACRITEAETPLIPSDPTDSPKNTSNVYKFNQ